MEHSKKGQFLYSGKLMYIFSQGFSGFEELWLQATQTFPLAFCTGDFWMLQNLQLWKCEQIQI